MAHTTRAHVTWMSAVIMVAVTASCITWLIVSRESNMRIRKIDGITVGKMLRHSAYTAQCIFKVKNDTSLEERLALEMESNHECSKSISLDKSNSYIMVEEQGVYLVYVQLTYRLQKDGNSSKLDIDLRVKFSYTESDEEFCGAYDTRHLTNDEEDSHLSAFLLLNMKAGNSLSILSHVKKKIKYEDHRPFTNYITIIRYADWRD